MKTVIHWPQFIAMIVLTIAGPAIWGWFIESVVVSVALGMFSGVLVPLVFMAFCDVWHFEDEHGRRI